jgi:hypothetical protein
VNLVVEYRIDYDAHKDSADSADANSFFWRPLIVGKLSESIALPETPGSQKLGLINVGAIWQFKGVRFLVEVLIIGGLIYLGWEQPFKGRFEQVQAGVRAATASKLKPATSQETVAPVAPTPSPAAIPQPRAIIAAPTPTPRGAWMWDEKHHSVLDRPAYDQTQPQQRYHDQYGRSYWIDANGVRHYDQ